jgi:GAF domain
LPNPWLAIDVATDPAVRALEVRRAWEGFLSGDSPSPDLRAPIAESWQRCASAGVDATHRPLLSMMSADEVRDIWAEHPLGRLVPSLHELLAEIADEARHVMVVADEEGRLLWIEGDSRVRSSAADEGSFVEGALWSEKAAGTNAVGTAIALDHAVQVFAAEHFNAVIQRWTCAAAPIHDPTSGRVLGVVDLTGRLGTVHPHNLALALAAAKTVETQLRAEQRERDATLQARHIDRVIRSAAPQRALVAADGRVLLSHPPGWAPPVVEIPAGGGELILPGEVRAVGEPLGPDGSFLLRKDQPSSGPSAPSVRLLTLGRDRGLISVHGREVRFSQRHTEILVLLVSCRSGMTAEELALALYGETGKPQTVRTELFRLRKLLGPGIESEPYRLTLSVDADFVNTEKLLRAGRPRDAAQRYCAPLLPHSEAPGIVEVREQLDAWVRHAVMTSDDREARWAWLQSSSGHDDLTVWKRFLSDLSFDDPRRDLAATRVAQLRESLSGLV